MANENHAGILIVGHGTRRKSGQEQFLSLFNQISDLFPQHNVAASFLELAEPSIEQGLQKLASLGARQIIVTPILLFRAGHAIDDIPRAVNSAADRLDLEIVGQTPPLDCHPVALQLSKQRFRQSVCQPEYAKFGNFPPACESCAARNYCSRTSLLMIGRGSNSASATQMMRKFTETRTQLTRVEHCETAFIHGQSPNIDEGFDWLSKQETPLAVVQPHLLFQGLLSRDIHKRVNKWQQQQPNRKWIVTDVLGSDVSLANAFAELIRETSEYF